MKKENILLVDSYFNRKYSFDNATYLLDDELRTLNNTIKINEVESFNSCY
jgi:hypothetical protein